MGSDAVAILLGARGSVRSNDTEYRFRQDSDFHYLTGFDHPNAAAVLRTDGGPRFTLYVEPRDPDAETWTGYRPGVEGAVADFGADEAEPSDRLVSQLPTVLSRAKHIHHVLGRDAAVDAQVVAVLDNRRLRSRQGSEPVDGVVDPRHILHEMRLVKEPAEIEIMRRAAAVTREAHETAARLARGGVHEYEVEAAIEYTFRRRGAAGPAYSTIVGGGANATVLHYITNDALLCDGELVLIDAGCELEGYASDVTRTFPVGGRYTGERRAVYEAVLAAQDAALDLCKPGATLVEIHDAAVRLITEGLVDMGLLSGRVDDLVADESYRRYYMHNTSHWLGLDVHDVGSYRLEGRPRALAPALAFTVEPGIYVPVHDESAPEGFRGIGVRIEDDVVITADGHENLSSGIPKTIADVEALVAGD
jgi:Xaa-Pro aminopeptidase